MALHVKHKAVFLLERKPSILQDVRYQLHDEAEDQRLCKLAQKQLKQIEKRQQQGQAVLPLLETSVIILACDDPGTVIGPQIILPTLRKRLLARAQSFHQATAMPDCLQVIVVSYTGRSHVACTIVCTAISDCSCI